MLVPGSNENSHTQVDAPATRQRMGNKLQQSTINFTSRSTSSARFVSARLSESFQTTLLCFVLHHVWPSGRRLGTLLRLWPEKNCTLKLLKVSIFSLTYFSQSTHLVRVDTSNSQWQGLWREPETLNADDRTNTQYAKLEQLPCVEQLSFVLLKNDATKIKSERSNSVL